MGLLGPGVDTVFTAGRARRPPSWRQGNAAELARSVLAELGQHEASTVIQRARNENLATMVRHGAPCAPTAA